MSTATTPGGSLFTPAGGSPCEAAVSLSLVGGRQRTGRGDSAPRRGDEADRPAIESLIVPTGDHYASMIEQGIPAAIEWLGRSRRALRDRGSHPHRGCGRRRADRKPGHARGARATRAREAVE